MSERFLDHLSAAIRVPTIADDEDRLANAEALDRLRSFLEISYPRTWAVLEIESIAEHSLLMSWSGSDPGLRPMVLMAHLDVVPVEPGTESRWTHPPFAAERTETHLIGRGAIDDKGSLIAVLEAVEASIVAGLAPQRTVILAFGHDEETMGSEGAAALAAILDNRGLRPVLVLDEGGFVTEGVVPGTSRPVALVGVSEKGYLDVEISSVGEPGHSSAPPKVTAIGAVAQAIAGLQATPMAPRLEVQAPFFAAASAAARPGARRLLRDLPRLRGFASRILGRRPSTDALVRTTMAPTVISGGVKSNVLAGSARAVINFRLMPGDTIESVLAHIASVVGDDVTVTVLRGWEAAPMSDTSSLGYLTVASIIEEVFPGAVVAPWVVIGATDARYFAGLSESVLRFLPFRMDADELTGFHGVDERIRLEDAEPAVRFYRTLIERLAG